MPTRYATRSVRLDGIDYAGAPITVDGTHQIVAVATDAVGNSSTAALRLVVDRTPPVDGVVSEIDTDPVAGVLLGMSVMVIAN